MELTDRVAIVTGGAVRLGQALSLVLAGAGIDVCVHYGSSRESATRTVAQIAALGRRAVAVQADLRNPAQAAATILDETFDAFGRADILVNSAAIFEPGTLATTTDEQWRRHFAINLEAPFCLAREFTRRLAPGGRGHIVNIADWRGTRPGVGHLAYTLTKSGLVTLTRILAQELAPDVQVNAIAPGAILPPPGEDRHALERIAGRIPLRRPGSPAEVTAALLYLLRSDFTTGEILHVSGGEEL